jgi:hypothetical protein
VRRFRLHLAETGMSICNRYHDQFLLRVTTTRSDAGTSSEERWLFPDNRRGKPMTTRQLSRLLRKRPMPSESSRPSRCTLRHYVAFHRAGGRRYVTTPMRPRVRLIAKRGSKAFAPGPARSTLPRWLPRTVKETGMRLLPNSVLWERANESS